MTLIQTYPIIVPLFRYVSAYIAPRIGRLFTTILANSSRDLTGHALVRTKITEKRREGESRKGAHRVIDSVTSTRTGRNLVRSLCSVRGN